MSELDCGGGWGLVVEISGGFGGWVNFERGFENIVSFMQKRGFLAVCALVNINSFGFVLFIRG